MDFRSDNTAAIHPEVLKALANLNSGNDSSYGNDSNSQALKLKLSDLFNHEIALALVATGTAANCIALRSTTPGHGTILTTQEAHLNNDEGQAPELMLGGAKIRCFSTDQRKFDVVSAKKWIEKAKAMKPHAGLPSTISITHANEWGDLYSLQELRDIRELCDQENLALHIDGARLANALGAQNLTLQEFYKIARPDVLSFGLTKNSGLVAEAVIAFNSKYFDSLIFAQKQLGQLLSKTRFMAVQFNTLLDKNLWLDLATHANSMAMILSETLCQKFDLKLASPVKTNQVFVHMSAETANLLSKKGAKFHNWDGDIYRFVCSWSTTEEDIKKLGSL